MTSLLSPYDLDLGSLRRGWWFVSGRRGHNIRGSVLRGRKKAVQRETLVYVYASFGWWGYRSRRGGISLMRFIPPKAVERSFAFH